MNTVELSQDFQYLLVNVHVIEYLNFKAKCAHVNKDILISLVDLRSSFENQNPGFDKKRGERVWHGKPARSSGNDANKKTKSDHKKFLKSLDDEGNEEELDIKSDYENETQRKALKVQQHISMKNQFVIEEVQEFDIYKEEKISENDMDQRVLKYLKKTINIFEYVHQIQMIQFIENWKP